MFEIMSYLDRSHFGIGTIYGRKCRQTGVCIIVSDLTNEPFGEYVVSIGNFESVKVVYYSSDLSDCKTRVDMAALVLQKGDNI